MFNCLKIQPSIIIATILAFIGQVPSSKSQVVNQITISPTYPTEADTIVVVSNFSYYGDCSYGMVYSNTFIEDSIIYIVPTYCGYGDSSLCTSIDTFTFGPFQHGNYAIRLDYHQGSICPISDFDIDLAQFDTSISVGILTSNNTFNPIEMRTSSIQVFPNPFSYSTTFKTDESLADACLYIYDSMGFLAVEIENISGRTICLNRSNLRNGLYFYYLIEGNKVLAFDKLLITD
jgi:hypothetical protein